jgi:1,5-anhydro-D-fructose reductase (1,5-anhydro-D-mannitol-forming)
MIGCGAVCEVKSGPGFYKADHSALLAVASADPALTRSYAARHGVPKVYDSAEALVQDPDLDAIYVATPPSSHQALSLLAARAGKHVYVEKPMALRFADCEAIINECRRLERRLYVAFYRRAMPRFLQVKAWVDAGAIGEVRCIGVVQHQPPAPEDRSRATLPWRLQPEVAGGGKFLDMGVHTLDFLDYVFGPIVEVQGIATNAAGLYDVEDTVTAAWRHQGGALGTGSWCYVGGDPSDRVEITGAQGRIEFEFFADTPLRLTTAKGTQEAAIPNPPHVQQPFIQSIVDDLNGIAPCPGTPESAARSSFIADEILRDYRRRRGY